MLPRLARACPVLLLALAVVANAAPPLPAEHLEIARMPARSPHWIYVFDEILASQTDSRIYVYDGDAHRELGQIDAGYWANFNVSPDGRTTAVATTYLSRGSRGTRTDVLELTDNATLTVTGEVVLPPKRANTLPTAYNVSFSADQHFVYSTNLTPAASFTVVDLAKAAVAGEIDTDGCVLAIPSAQRRVSSLCENGRLLTVILDDSGHETARSVSAPFFNIDRDPVFAQGVPVPAGVLFLSFLGDVYQADLSGAEPKFTAPWPLVSAQQRGHWRPGGQQVAAYQPHTKRLYVPMHRGADGSHKDGGTEIWVFDTATRKRLARWPVNTPLYGPVLATQVSQDEQPLLFVTTENGALLLMNAASGHVEHVEPKFGQSLWYLINP